MADIEIPQRDLPPGILGESLAKFFGNKFPYQIVWLLTRANWENDEPAVIEFDIDKKDINPKWVMMFYPGESVSNILTRSGYLAKLGVWFLSINKTVDNGVHRTFECTLWQPMLSTGRMFKSRSFLMIVKDDGVTEVDEVFDALVGGTDIAVYEQTAADFTP